MNDDPARVPTDLQRDLAAELWDADRTAVPIAPLTERHPDLVLADAYAIQTINIDRRVADGQRVIGRKVGLTSKPMQKLLGVDEPDFGVLTETMVVEDGDEVDLATLVQPRVEAEMAFVMGRDLAGPGVTTGTALAAIAGVLPAIEIVDSRVADWKIKLVDTVADNASSGLIVTGGRMTPLADIDLRLVGVVVSRGRRGAAHRGGGGRARQPGPLRGVARQHARRVRRGAPRGRHRAAGLTARDGGRGARRRVPRGVRAPRTRDGPVLP